MGKNKQSKSGKFFDLTDLNDWTSPFSFLVMGLCFFLCYTALFRPSLGQFGIMLAVDMAMTGIFKQFEFKIFVKMFPEMTSFAPSFENKKLNGLSLNEKISTIKAMMEFPLKRAWYVCYASAVKCAPAALVIVFIWNLHGRSHLEQLLLLMAMVCLIFSFFFAVTFIESHLYLSKKLKELSSQNNEWKEAFFKVEVAKNHKSFSNTYKYSMVCLSIVGLWLANSVVLLVNYSSATELSFYLTGVVSIVILLTGRIVVLYGKVLDTTMTDIFTKVDQIEHDRDIFIPLHTISHFARFEQGFNFVTRNLAKKEAESQQMLEEIADKSRFQSIGELSSLLTHDMATPIHVILNLMNTMKKDIGKFSAKHVHHMELNVNKLNDLVSALRLKLKNAPQAPKASYLAPVIESVKVLLLTQYRHDGMDAACVEVDPKISNLHISMSRIMLTSLIENLMKNSAHSAIEKKGVIPKISFKLSDLGDRLNPQLTIIYKDNGTGISREQFNKMTDYTIPPDGNSLGIRLARKIAELEGGRLQVTKWSSEGTTFKIILPKVVEAPEDESLNENISYLFAKTKVQQPPDLRH